MELSNTSEPYSEERMAEAGLPGALLETPAELEQAEEKAKPRSPFQESLQRFRRDKRAMVSLFVLIIVLFLSLVFPPIYQHIGQPLHRQVAPGFVDTTTSEQYHSPDYIDAFRRSQYPSALHWLGTDDNGQDLLARLLKGWQVSLLVAFAVEIQDIILGVFFGVIAGYFGGILDAFLSRFTDLVFAFPGLLFVILVTAIYGEKFDNVSLLGFQFGNYGRLVLASLVLGFTIWPLMARYVRGQTLQLKEQQFIEAARTNGTRNIKIIWRHILPNIASLIVVAATLDMATTVVAEGTLSLLGLGVKAPGSSLGLMVSQYSNDIQGFSFEILWPVLGIVVLVLALSFIGDGLRDAFDPHTKD
jgi:oligopeptide transport system permease protein